MKPNNTVVAEVESTFNGEAVAMGFDEEAMTHLMGILSEIYTNPVEAVAREYMTNAIDSHIEAGTKRPVEITTPNYFNPNLIIRDYGIGMDIEDIRRTYSKYGASTKRGSDAVNGMLGIGSKSAFAYSNNFTVVGIKNGIKTSIVVSRDEEGGGDMTIIDKTETDEPSGTTVSFTVYNIDFFNEQIREFAGNMAKGLLLVDGEDLSKWDSYTKVVGTVRNAQGEVVLNGIYHTDAIRYYDDEEDTIYMGGVSYPALTPLSEVRPKDRYNIMADVPLGKIKFTPSRESLEDVKSVRDMHEFIERVYTENIVSAVTRESSSGSSGRSA